MNQSLRNHGRNYALFVCMYASDVTCRPPELSLLQAPALLVFSYCTHTLKVSSAQSKLTPDTVLTAAVVVGGALLDPHARLFVFRLRPRI
jgi:hypothetical protein